MESSDEEDFSTHEWITPQSKINSIFQSHTEKGVRKLCCELLDLKDAVENLCGNMRTKYLAFLRISDEVLEMEHELIELQKHTSAQGIIVQDLMSAVSRELQEWARANPDTHEPEQGPQICGPEDHPSPNETEHEALSFVDFDVLLAEHRVDEAIDALAAEERGSENPDLLKRKEILVDQLVEIAEQPLVTSVELKKALVGLLKLGKGPTAHQLLLKSHGSRLKCRIEYFLPSCSLYPETYSATLAKFVFSAISSMTKESGSIFGDNPIYTNRLVQWAEWEIESFVRLVKENGPMSEMASALRGASICVEAGLSHCSKLELQGLKLSKLLMVLLWPYIEEVLEMNFRRARRVMLAFSEFDDNLLQSPHFGSPLGFTTTSDGIFSDSGTRFMFIVEDLVDQLTPMAIFHFGGNILNRILQLFDKYVDALIKAMPSPSDDDHLAELKETIIPFRAETDSQQLALLGTAFTVADELLPSAVSRIWNESTETRSGPTETKVSNNIMEFKEWRRNLQPSLDKLRDHFCRQYVLNFIYSREGKTRLDAHIYLNGDGDGDADLFWDSDPLPSLPFQALFGKLQQLATVAGDVLLGREKIQKVLLARLTETVVIWLSDEQEFWGVFEDTSAPLHSLGLQQLILDMHFTVEIARFAGYPSRHIHQIASAINARAIRTFAARGIDPQSALPEDEWFVETARAAINKLLLVASGSDASETDDEHIILHGEIVSDSDDTPSSLSSVESSDSFASANMGEIESPDDSE